MKTALVLNFAAVLALCCCTAVQSACNGVSAPEKTLQELHRGCSSNARTRNSDCYAAYHRYCSQATYPTARVSIGVSREHSNGRVGLSCVQAHWKGDVTIQDLSRIHGGCNTAAKAQHRDCLSAIHNYCIRRFGQDFAGISQEVPSAHRLYIGCFRAAFKEFVPVNVMTSLHAYCRFPASESDNCFASAHRYCSRFHGLSGGITQEVNTSIMAVACYNADLSRDAHIQRTSDYYRDRRQVVEICSLEFNTSQGRIVHSSPERLEAVTYLNTAVRASLKSTFTVLKHVTETSRFEYPSLLLHPQATLSTKIPYYVDGEILLSLSATATFGTTGATSVVKTYDHTSEVEVPPRTRIVKEASITRDDLEVPWRAVVKTGLGKLSHINGKWYGASTCDLRVTQRSILLNGNNLG